HPPPTPSPTLVPYTTLFRSQAVESVCGCSVTPFFDAHVRGANPIDFDRYLALAGLKTQVSWGPAMYNGERERDLRMWGFERDSRDRKSTRLNSSHEWSSYAV